MPPLPHRPPFLRILLNNLLQSLDLLLKIHVLRLEFHILVGEVIVGICVTISVLLSIRMSLCLTSFSK